MMCLLRSGMLEVLDSEYVKLARVKGVTESRVVWVHALKNALIPVVTFAGIYFSILVTTAIVVETVFAWPGLGRLAYEAISSRDFPVIQAVVLTTAVIVAVVNLSVDCVYALIDPRIRYARHRAGELERAAPTPSGRGSRAPPRATAAAVAGGVAHDHRGLRRRGAVRPRAEPRRSGEQTLRRRFTPPVWEERGSWTHLLGTDRLGRDLLSRIIWGSRVSLTAGVLTVLLASAVGAGVGLVAGYYGGRVDTVLMRVTDTTMSFPVILLALILAVTVGAELHQRGDRYRGDSLGAFRARDPRAGAHADGARLHHAGPHRGRSAARIIIRHLFPNTLNTLVVLTTLQVGYVIIVEASLSFLGAGIPPPTPAWGSMIAEGRDFVTSAWWVSFFPGLAILLVVLAFNLLGDWLRDTLDPKLRQL